MTLLLKPWGPSAIANQNTGPALGFLNIPQCHWAFPPPAPKDSVNFSQTIIPTSFGAVTLRWSQKCVETPLQ